MHYSENSMCADKYENRRHLEILSAVEFYLDVSIDSLHSCESAELQCSAMQRSTVTNNWVTECTKPSLKHSSGVLN